MGPAASLLLMSLSSAVMLAEVVDLGPLKPEAPVVEQQQPPRGPPPELPAPLLLDARVPAPKEPAKAKRPPKEPPALN